MGKRIVLAHSWSNHNIGDIGITPGMVELLRRYVPEHTLTVLSMHQHGSSEYQTTRGYLTEHFPGIRVIGSPAQEFRDQRLAAVLFEPPVPFLRSLHPEYASAMLEADFVLYNPGTTLSFGRWDKDFWGRTLSFSLPLVLARRMGIPYGIYANSFERFDYPGDVFFRWLLAKARFLSTRETDSLRMLEEKDMTAGIPDVRFGMESTIAFPFRDDPWAQRFLSEHGLKPRTYIALTIRTSAPPLTPVSEARRSHHMESMVDCITWAHHNGWKALICPEVEREIERGRTELLPRIPRDVMGSLVYMDRFWSPEQALSVYSQAGALVTMEFHSVLLALQTEVPILHPFFAEAGRKRQMLVDMGLRDYLFDLDSDESKDLTRRLDEVSSDWSACSNRFRDAYQKMCDVGRQSMRVVADAVART